MRFSWGDVREGKDNTGAFTPLCGNKASIPCSVSGDQVRSLHPTTTWHLSLSPALWQWRPGGESGLSSLRTSNEAIPTHEGISGYPMGAKGKVTFSAQQLQGALLISYVNGGQVKNLNFYLPLTGTRWYPSSSALEWCQRKQAKTHSLHESQCLLIYCLKHTGSNQKSQTEWKKQTNQYTLKPQWQKY